MSKIVEFRVGKCVTGTGGIGGFFQHPRVVVCAKNREARRGKENRKGHDVKERQKRDRKNLGSRQYRK
jgi:hypothetical protein